MSTKYLKSRHGKVAWWSPGLKTENIGDFLSFYFAMKLVERLTAGADVYRLVGSVISPDIIQKDIDSVTGKDSPRIAYWGCGCRTAEKLPAALRAHTDFFGVRGPLTRDALDLPPGAPLGDPALLLPLLHSPAVSKVTAGRLIFVPHVFDVLNVSAERLLRCSQAEVLVSPIISSTAQSVERFIDDICSADFVLAGSLHSAIIACAYGIPFSYFDTGYVDEPFKWRDFSASINVGCYFPRSLNDARTVHRELLARQISRPPLAPLLEAAPFRARSDILAKAREHRWS